jgi:hypothetical protein
VLVVAQTGILKADLAQEPERQDWVVTVSQLPTRAN